MGVAAFLFTTITGYGVAFAQDEGGDSAGSGDASGDGTGDGTANPCGGAANPCSGAAAAGGEATPAAGEAAAPGGEATRPMTLPKGGIEIGAIFQANLSTDKAFKPFAIAPDVSYGVSDKLTATVETSDYAITGFWTGLGPSGLCLAGDTNGCPKVFDVFGLEGMFDLGKKGPVMLAVHGGLLAKSLDAGDYSLKAGLKGMWMSGKMGIMFDPSITIGLTNRSIDMAGVSADHNVEELLLPVAFMYMLNEKLHVGVQTGIHGQLAHFGDTDFIPLALGAAYMVNPNLEVGGAFSLDRLAGVDLGPSVGAADLRSLAIFGTWRK